MRAGDVEACSAAEGLRRFASSSPFLAAAVRRLCERQAELIAKVDRLGHAGEPQQAQQSAANKQLAVALQMAVQAALCTLAGAPPDQARPAAQPAARSNGGAATPDLAPSLPYPGSGAARHVAQVVLSAPDLTRGLPQAQRAQLTDLSVFPACLAALRGLGAPDQAAEAPLMWRDCLWALGNVTGLVAGSLVTRQLEVCY